MMSLALREPEGAEDSRWLSMPGDTAGTGGRLQKASLFLRLCLAVPAGGASWEVS